jgi:hypothetical protein
MKIRVYILSLLAFGMALVLLMHFGCIWFYGEFLITEPNTMILTIETMLMAGIMFFSMFCLFDQLRNTAHEGKQVQVRERVR